MNNTDEPLVARSRIDDYFHREPIARVRRGVLGGAASASQAVLSLSSYGATRPCLLQIEWMKDVLSRDYAVSLSLRRTRCCLCGLPDSHTCMHGDHIVFQLASVSADGKVLFWSLANKLATPTHGYDMQRAHSDFCLGSLTHTCTHSFRLVPTRSMRRAGKRRDAANSVVGGNALRWLHTLVMVLALTATPMSELQALRCRSQRTESTPLPSLWPRKVAASSSA